MKSKPVVTTLIGSMLLGTAAMAGGRAPDKKDDSTTLSNTEISTLQFMREEEKLARDVYLTLNGYWGSMTNVFANISESEEKHTSSIEYLLDKYGIEDPVARDEVGLFANPDLQKLYDQLIVKGTTSMVDGLYVGALIEEKDMNDIASAIQETDERSIILVYSNLLDGSENHLRAFVDVIEAQGLVYEAQILDAEEVELILESSSDSGRD